MHCISLMLYTVRMVDGSVGSSGPHCNTNLYVSTTVFNTQGNMLVNEMGGACGAYRGGERCAQGSSGET